MKQSMVPCFDAERYDPDNPIWPPMSEADNVWRGLPIWQTIFKTWTTRRIGIRVAFEMLIECGIWQEYIRRVNERFPEAAEHLLSVGDQLLYNLQYGVDVQEWRRLDDFFGLDLGFPHQLEDYERWMGILHRFITITCGFMAKRLRLNPIFLGMIDSVSYAQQSYSDYWATRPRDIQLRYTMLRYFMGRHSTREVQWSNSTWLLDYIFMEEWRTRCLQALPIDRFRATSVT